MRRTQSAYGNALLLTCWLATSVGGPAFADEATTADFKIPQPPAPAAIPAPDMSTSTIDEPLPPDFVGVESLAEPSRVPVATQLQSVSSEMTMAGGEYVVPSQPTTVCTECFPMTAECHPGGFYFGAEYLYMRARRRNLDFAVVDQIDDGLPQGSIISADWEPNSGYRLGGGYRLPGEGWQIGAEYTYFHASDDRQATAPTNGLLYATQMNPAFSDGEATSATASSNLNYNVVDVMLGREFNVSKRMTMGLYGGGRFASIDQKRITTYLGTDVGNSTVSNPQDFDGSGLTAATTGHVRLFPSLSLFAKAGGSILYGQTTTSYNETNTLGANTSISENYEQLVPVIEAAIGLSYHWRFMELTLGYQMINWFDLVDQRSFTDGLLESKTADSSGSLTLDGLFLQMTFRR